jgi:ABC-type Fe3+/spermidine/putrescine transport system ATPase subunit
VTQFAITGLTKGFSGRTVLDHVDLQVPPNSLTAILGPSGSGKTTLLRVIAGFEHADSGTVTLGGAFVDGPGRYQPSERRRIGYVPQEGSLFPHLTVAANVGFGLPRRERRGAAVGDLLSTADQVAVLRGGKIAQCAARLDLYTQPADPELARFVGEANPARPRPGLGLEPVTLSTHCRAIRTWRCYR